MSYQQNEFNQHDFLKSLNLSETTHGYSDGVNSKANGTTIQTFNPNNGKPIANVIRASVSDYQQGLKLQESAFKEWSSWPMPKRGDVIRDFGDALRKHKEALGRLIALEVGKIYSEGLGEVQEVIDMCDFACGLSRTISGGVLPSERKDHVLLETWNPLGIIGVITAFNFPHAVFGWNACLALVCGNCVMWKGSENTGLVTMATTYILQQVLEKHNAPKGVVVGMVACGIEVGDLMVKEKKVNLISFTGSTRIGRKVNEMVAQRFGKTILELGGNNAMIVCEDADMNMAFNAIYFSAVGTCGQRCTSLRRLYLHESIYEKIKEQLVSSYKHVKIGSSLEEGVQCGPLMGENAVKIYLEGLEEIKKQGGKILSGGKRIEREGFFVEPTIVEIDPRAEIVQEELFVPILYIFKFKDLDEAIAFNNDVPQGLSSSIFTNNMKNVFRWIGPHGSDCGLINVNVGTSGAEIGGAFGGEKETGGGRESGSDAWKQYMRRGTCTVNFSDCLPLAQGIEFGPKLQNNQ